MSEFKRVALNTLEPQIVSDKPCKKKSKTIRISVILPESNEDKCPEYNYKDELEAVKKRQKQKENPKEASTDNHAIPNGLDPFGEDDDDDVRRIALEMEQKYGNNVPGKKKRKGRKDDYADIGMGYDESDSFIDNTDGYDEIIPQNVTTLHGGFYINCGALEFKTDDEASSDVSSSSESDSPEKPTKKRFLETTDEESGGEEDKDGQTEKKPKLQSVKNSMQQAIKKKLFSQNKIQVKKRRLIDPVKKTVKELLREKRHDLNMSIPSEFVVPENNEENSALKENKKPMSISSVTDAIESVVKANLMASPAKPIPVEIHSQNLVAHVPREMNDDNPVVTQMSMDSDSSHTEDKVEIVKLPENLPADILDIINRIKKAALENKEGKVKFFNDEVKAMLLSLERKCKCLGKPSKTKVYEHLSPFVRCKKETLLKRAKNLVLEDDEKKLKRLLTRLKNDIDKIMPSLIENHQMESQKVLQRKFSQESVENEETKALRMPKRRFQWSDETKKLLRDILATKKRCCVLEGKQKEVLEEQVTSFLKTTVQPLWPEGWMSIAALNKVCNNQIEARKQNAKAKNNMVNHDKHSQNTNSPLSYTQPTTTSNNLSIIPITSNSNSTKSSYNPTKSDSISSEFTVSKICNNNTETTETKQKLSSSKEEKVVDRQQLNKHNIDLLIKPIDSSSVIVTSQKSLDKDVRTSLEEPIIAKLPGRDIEIAHYKKDESYYKANIIKDVDYREKDLSHRASTGSLTTKPLPKKDLEITHSFNSRDDVYSSSKHNHKDSQPHSRVDDNVIIRDRSYIREDYIPLPKEKHIPEIPLSPQLIDLTESSTDIQRVPSATKTKIKVTNEEQPQPLQLTKDKDYNHHHAVDSLINKPQDLSYPNNISVSTPNMDYIRNEGDEFKKVMEDLKALQQLSSPIKSVDTSTSSPVSVIAFNKNFATTKPASQNNVVQRTEFNNKDALFR